MEALIVIGIIFVLFIIIKISAFFNEKTDLQNNLSNCRNELSKITKLLQQKEAENAKLILLKKDDINKLTTKISDLEDINLSYKKALEEIDKETGYDNTLFQVVFETEKDRIKFLINYEKEKILRYIRENNFCTDIMKKIKESLVEKLHSYKWLAGMMADYLTIAESEYHTFLKSSTRANDLLRAIRIKELTDKEKKVIKENKILRYELEYIKTLIPEVEDITEYDETGSGIDEEGDYLSNFLPKEEYEKLSDTEKNERSLEFYLNRKKTNWEIGRDFERYVGYTFEKKGYRVEYYGIEKKLNDLGRDLILQNDEQIVIVQCKYWSKYKVIHEKHIAQLYGTLVKYKLDNPKNKKDVIGIFVTHTKISDEARRFADALEIGVVEELELGEYPLIKCNVNHDNYGNTTKIYHLPMDLQYDIVKIRQKEGDFYAFTIAEAEKAGFRRAYRWRST
ncbi:MAG: restriction endonuclease [Treponema sp.]|nr:restriction endonuclease [Treponema sp.]